MEPHYKQLRWAGSLAVILTALTVAACGGGGGSAFATARTAAQVITSDGYIQVTAAQSSEVATILSDGGLPAADTSSVAVGVSAKDGLGNDTSGTSTYQEVAILTAAGLGVIDKMFAATQKRDAAAGVSLTLNGDVLTGTGTGSAIESLS